MMAEDALECMECRECTEHPFADGKSIIGIDNLQDYLGRIDLENLQLIEEEVKQELEFRKFSLGRIHSLKNKLSAEKIKLLEDLEELCSGKIKLLEELEELRLQKKKDELLNEDEISSNTDETMAGVREKVKKSAPRKIPAKKSKSKKSKINK